MPVDDQLYQLSDVLKTEFEAIRGSAEVEAQLQAAWTRNRPAMPGDPPLDAEQAQRNRIYDAAHNLNLTALCLSGGGIRSAALSLGVIQGLVDNNRLLREFNYLSTVSGGGYIGSWLSAWLHRAGNAEDVLNRLGSSRSTPDRETPPLDHLREYSNYLTPKMGLLSADAWTGLAIVMRNIAVNWLILVPALALVVIAIKLAMLGLSAPLVPGALAATDDGRAVAGLLAVLCVLAGSAAFGYKLGRLYVPPYSEGGRDAPEPQSQRRFLWYSLLPAVLGGFFFVWLARQNLTPLNALAQATLGPEGATAVNKRILSALQTVFDPVWATRLDRFLAGLLFALLVYALAILFAGACRFCLGLPVFPAHRLFGMAARDFACWIGAVAVFAVVVTAGAYAIRALPDTGLCSLDAQVCLARDSVIAVFAVPWFLMATMNAHFTYLLLRSHSDKSESEREWLGRASGWHFIAALAWLALSAIVLLGPAIYYNIPETVKLATAVSGAVTGILGKSGLTPAKGAATTWSGFGANIALAVAGPLFAATLLILLSVVADWTVVGWNEACFPTNNRWNPRCHTAWWLLPLGVAGAVLCVSNYFANINSFALHAVYRNRLVRCFLGGARSPYRRPEAFTDFDWDDDLRVAGLWPAAIPPAVAPPLPTGANWRPLHVINMTLNLTATNRLAWQQRKAAAFSVTPFACGSAETGYRATQFYGGPAMPPEHGEVRSGISLGSAMAISGAAVSSNMGYHSSMSLSFLLTFFNVRLGVWLGNPKRGQGQNAPYAQPGPRFAVRPLLSELLGLTTEDSDYVYLSDGGHFEDLGLYEMVRRRCRLIVVVDGDQDGGRGFGDLGNAVRKIWIDLGARVTFKSSPLLQAEAEAKLGVVPYFAVGKIEYLSDPLVGDPPTRVREGKLLYIKPLIRGDEAAADVIAYKRAHAEFPAQTTADQWFDEPQFESYRRLGHLMIDQIVEATGVDRPTLTLQRLFDGLGNIDLAAMAKKPDPLADATC